MFNKQLSLLFALTLPFMSEAKADLLVNFNSSDINPSYNVTFSNNSGGFDLGYKFAVNFPLSVVQLGVYDDFGDGLIGSHEVGLFKADGTLITSTTVQTTDALNGVFRFAPISPVELTPGEYVLVSVAGYNPGNPVDNYTHDPFNISFDPNITFLGNRVLGNVGNTLLFLSDANTEVSTDPFLQYGWFGPNMDVVAVSVPEPATILTLLGMGAVVARIRAKKNAE